MHDDMLAALPRPEAREMEEGELLPPVARAVKQLGEGLLAVSRGPVKQEIARCFLVSGERGCGKTTVLFSARKHYANRRRDDTSQPTSIATEEGRLFWLHVLDVENMPADSNLLIYMLLRVRAALAPEGEEKHGLLEQLHQKPIAALDGLMSAAAQVWGAIAEPTTRERAHREVAVAQSYGSFRKELTDTLKAVGKALAPDAGSTAATLVLPIDNIDCSPQHLRAIFKLAQWVTCPNLLLVLAGDMTHMHALLERSYWNELMQGAAGSVAPCGDSVRASPPVSTPDREMLMLARRQAAAAMNKTIPKSQRIDVKSLTAQEVFESSEKLIEKSNLIENLFALPLSSSPSEPTTHRKTARDDERDDAKASTFCDLFVHKRVGESADRSDVLTELGSAALQLPARTLVDMTLLAARLRQHPELACPNSAPTLLAHTMLNLLLDDSALPHEAVRLVQERILQRRTDGSIDLQLSAEPYGGTPYAQVDRRSTYARSFLLDRASHKRGASGARRWSAELLVVKPHGFQITTSAGQQRSESLPMVASAWFLLLNDALASDPQAEMPYHPDSFYEGLCAPGVQVLWTCADPFVQTSLTWPSPSWIRAEQHARMDAVWREALDEFVKFRGSEKLARARDSDNLASSLEKQGLRARRWLAAAWIAAVCWVAREPPEERPKLPSIDRPVEDLTSVLHELADGYRSFEGDFLRGFEESSPQRRSMLPLYYWVKYRLLHLYSEELQTGLSPKDAPEWLKGIWKPIQAQLDSQRRSRLLQGASSAVPAPGEDAFAKEKAARAGDEIEIALGELLARVSLSSKPVERAGQDTAQTERRWQTPAKKHKRNARTRDA